MIAFARRRAIAPLLATILALASCKDDKTIAPVAVLTTIEVALPGSAIMVGQTTTAAAAGLDQDNAPIATGTIAWSSAPTGIVTVSDAGVVTGVAEGTAQVIATAGAVVGQTAITVTAPPAIIFNEVESNGGTPGDWAELYNPTGAAVDLAGWVFKDNDDTHAYAIPAGTTIAAGAYLVLEEGAFGFGLGAVEAVRLFSPYTTLVASYSWTAHAATTYGRCPNLTGSFIATTSSTKGTANDCSIAVKVNEVESSGGTPGDWIELYNAGGSPVDLSGYVVKDDDDTHAYTIPAATSIAPGAYLVVEESSLGFGLGQPDAARLFSPASVLIDSYNWTTHATTTYGRCPNGSGAFATTTVSTKGTTNACPGATTTSVWPGSPDIQVVDGFNVFGTNMSGLTYEGAAGVSPAVLWAVKNGPGTLYRLIWNGTIWTPDASNGWGAGRPLRYTDGNGDADAEGVTYASGGSAGGIYVSSERNNSANSVSRNSILRFDPAQVGATLVATNDWNITADLPVVGANLGIEAVTWIPDVFLTARGFFDEGAGHTYNPADYADHGTGLFFVGVEANGNIYGYALNHVNNTFARVATISTGFPGVMGLEFDRELNYFWALCDDGCGGLSAILEVDQAVGSPTLGRFVVTRRYDRPTGMPNINNEGFAIAPQAECVAGTKSVFWSDDGGTGGYSIRRGSIPCAPLP